MSGELFDYKFGAKNNWRRWAWNRIAERVEDRKNAICLYLPSSTDYDRQIATSKGFSDHNLIGVEKNRAALKLARGNGDLIIHGDFFDAVDAVFQSHNVDVIFGDFCCGLTPVSIVRTAEIIFKRPLEQMVFTFNFLRGRDAESNIMRFQSSGIKRRSSIFLLNVITQLATVYRIFDMVKSQSPAQSSDKTVLYSIDELTEIEKRNIMRMAECSGAVMNEYLSNSGQVFDSIVFKNPLPKIFAENPSVKEPILKVYSKYSKFLENANGKTKMSAAAIMAHRTMRMN